jgi:hypothetical protein
MALVLEQTILLSQKWFPLNYFGFGHRTKFIRDSTIVPYNFISGLLHTTESQCFQMFPIASLSCIFYLGGLWSFRSQAISPSISTIRVCSIVILKWPTTMHQNRPGVLNLCRPVTHFWFSKIPRPLPMGKMLYSIF